MTQIIDCIRLCDGILTLVYLITQQVEMSIIHNEDSIRSLACKALLGLVRNENIRLVVEKLPLFAERQLQVHNL